MGSPIPKYDEVDEMKQDKGVNDELQKDKDEFDFKELEDLEEKIKDDSDKN